MNTDFASYMSYLKYSLKKENEILYLGRLFKVCGRTLKGNRNTQVSLKEMYNHQYSKSSDDKVLKA